MRGRPAGSCVNRREDTGTGTLPGHRRPHWPRRSAFRDGDLLLRLGAFGLRDLGRCVVVGDRARLLEVVPHLVALVRLPAAPQVTLVAHARDLLSRWGAHVPRSSERVKSPSGTCWPRRRARAPGSRAQREDQSPDSASPNGVPSESRHTDQASPAWITLPPSPRTARARAPCRQRRNTGAMPYLPARGRARGSRPRAPHRGFDARSPPARRAPRGGARAALPRSGAPARGHRRGTRSATTARRARAQSYRSIEQNQRMSTPGKAGPERLPDGPGMAVLVIPMPGG